MSVNAFDLLHLDVWGPFATESVDGYRNFLTIVDDSTRVTWIHMLRKKSEVKQVFPEFFTYISTQYKVSVEEIRTDNSPELAFPELIKRLGIKHYFSCAYTPLQNSVVERKHQHLLNLARALLYQSNIPLAYWRDCVLTASFLINRTPSPLLNNLSPYEVMLRKTPDYNALRSFGCLCYVSTLPKDRNKFSPCARSCVFLGYPSGYKEYKVLDLDTQSISISRHVVFHETVFPYKSVFPDFFGHTILLLSTPYIHDASSLSRYFIGLSDHASSSTPLET